MSTIPPRFMSELRDRLSLSEVIGRRVKLTRAGREFKACCPFHHEKSPSFYINDDKQFYHCFGCQAHGDVIEFTMRHDNLSFIEAVEVLAAQAGMQVPKASPQDIERSKKEKNLYDLMAETAKWFQKKLFEDAHRDALMYMRERGISDDLMASFMVGFSPADTAALPRHLKTIGFTESQMIEAGVVKASTRGGDAYSFFRDRVMFPVPDRRGRVVAFGGRVLPEHLRPLKSDESKPPKYINSSETTLFRKGEMLFGEPQARQAAHDGQPLIVVEGYLDVMAAFDAGYRGALAPLGTALTEAQILSLWKMIPAQQKVPVMCFDGDDAGRRAAQKAMGRILPLLRPDHSVRFAFLPNGQDPDSLIKAQGKEAFDSVINAAVPLIDVLWLHHTAGQKFVTPEERAGLSRAIENDVLLIPDRDVQHFYRDELRRRVRQSFSVQPPSRTQQSAQGRQQRDASGRSATQGLVLRKPAAAENNIRVLVLLACAINNPGILRWVEEDLSQVEITENRFSTLRQEIMDNIIAEPELDSEELRSRLVASGFGLELDLILSDMVYTHAGFARANNNLDIVRKGWQDTVSFMQKKVVLRELRAAGDALATDFSDENARRVMALQRSSRASGEQE